jgi:hypothetical protein
VNASAFHCAKKLIGSSFGAPQDFAGRNAKNFSANRQNDLLGRMDAQRGIYIANFFE